MVLGQLEVRLASQAATLAERRPRSQTVEPHSLPSLLLATFISWRAEQRKNEFASVSPALATLSCGSESLVQPPQVLVSGAWGWGRVGGRVLASGLPGKAHCLSWAPWQLARSTCQRMPPKWPGEAPRLTTQDSSSSAPSSEPAADTRPRPTKGPVCPGLAYPAPSSPPPAPMPSMSAEGHRLLTGGASWGLRIGLGTRWKGRTDSRHGTWHHTKPHPGSPFPSSLRLCPLTCQ